MDIDESGVQRLMPHKIFDGQKVRPIFIEMGTKSMPEGMAGDPMLPSKGSFMGPHMAADIKGREGNVTKLRLLYDKNIIKKVGEIVSSAFFAFQGQHK